MVQGFSGSNEPPSIPYFDRMILGKLCSHMEGLVIIRGLNFFAGYSLSFPPEKLQLVDKEGPVAIWRGRRCPSGELGKSGPNVAVVQDFIAERCRPGRALRLSDEV